ncbi:MULTISPECIES: transposase [Chryseobacterium]|uniref:Transposase n=1 Tax=Chryseobacterium camelliae TaxID=1265445 RepID=A0ABU0TE73_9FLAO|nr:MULTISPECIES: transposase [Chryseobacterium]MDT3406951.1 hypothetical protein [Pseudacidovorax intermedius]MDQ1095256.1 hypothetical protein [Chryseobacterium camelliae]MDQ1099194.1 hypothetical protein [Chryseobacterium sp. SORGH_AS_1048]MDR6086543.1 hypothetical protein [Chryseobacterium sp. SORGH_AS_0909]MDR6130914.1 hypothetical protein [Chryseobacterium sp. SORGH_AS_1175]
MNFKQIHIGKLIEQRVQETQIELTRICKFFDCTEKEIAQMYEAENLYADFILKWCKLLEYDFFRIYSQHLILYAPIDNQKYENKKTGKLALPSFRKNIYTKEIIEFVIELIRNETKTTSQITEEYNIPKTTLYKWLQKYSTIRDRKIS